MSADAFFNSIFAAASRRGCLNKSIHSTARIFAPCPQVQKTRAFFFKEEIPQSSKKNDLFSLPQRMSNLKGNTCPLVVCKCCSSLLCIVLAKNSKCCLWKTRHFWKHEKRISSLVTSAAFAAVVRRTWEPNSTLSMAVLSAVFSVQILHLPQTNWLNLHYNGMPAAKWRPRSGLTGNSWRAATLNMAKRTER